MYWFGTVGCFVFPSTTEDRELLAGRSNRLSIEVAPLPRLHRNALTAQ